MATTNYTLNNNTTLNGTVEITQKNGTVITLNTANKYLPKNIELTCNVDAGTMQASVSQNIAGSASMAATGMATSNSATSYYVTLSTNPGSVKAKAHCNSEGYITTSTSEDNETSATNVNVTGNGDKIYIPAAVGSVTMVAGNGSCTYNTDSTTGSKNITVSDIDTSGIKFVAIGSGELSASAKITTAGYAPQTASNSSFASGSSTSSNSATLIKYVTGVKIEKPEENTRSFDIEVPNGYVNGTLQYITFHFTVDSNGNTVIT